MPVILSRKMNNFLLIPFQQKRDTSKNGSIFNRFATSKCIDFGFTKYVKDTEGKKGKLTLYLMDLTIS
jgi:hypothetical protein